jgi:methyl-accepting chemotaxis protein
MPGFKDLPVYAKLSLLIGICLASFVGFALISRSTLNEVRVGGPIDTVIIKNKDLLADTVPPPLSLLEPYLLTHVLQDETDPSKHAALSDRLLGLEKLAEERFVHWEQGLEASEIKTQLLNDVQKSNAEFWNYLNTVFKPALAANDAEAKDAAASKLYDFWQADEKNIAVLVEKLNAQTKADQDEASAILGSRNRLLGVISIVGAGLILGIGFFIARGLSRPMSSLLVAMKDIAQGEGDLTKRIALSSKDEVGQLGAAFNLFVEKIAGTIARVEAAASKLATTSATLASSSQQVSAGLTTQSQQVTQVAAAVEEMSASINEVASKTSETSLAAAEAGTTAEAGGSVVDQTVQDIKLISQAVNDSSKLVTQLGKRGEQIGQIIKVINDIAEQTNLLALNAAIEAARAGEHGRGFAVVADEVRKLADRTTKATEEIGVSIKAIQEETVQAVEKMSVGTSQVDRGVLRATEAGTNLTSIVENARRVASMVQTIAAATEEQGAVSTEISKSIETISSGTLQAAEGGRVASDAAQQVAAYSEELRTLVGAFKIDRGQLGTGPIDRSMSPAENLSASGVRPIGKRTPRVKAA